MVLTQLDKSFWSETEMIDITRLAGRGNNHKPTGFTSDFLLEVFVEFAGDL